MDKIFKLILVLSFAVPLTVQAQFDNYGGVDEEAREEKGEGGESAAPKLKVDSKDFKALSDAKETRDEELFVRAVSKILGRDQTNLDALNALAVFYIEKNKLGLAKIILNRALETHPDEKALHNNLGIIYLYDGELRLAISSFKKAVGLNRNYRIGLANLGSIYLEFGDYLRAIEPLEAGYSLIKGDIRGNKEAVEIANNYAVALVGAGEASKAKSIYEKILDSDSRNIGVLLNYATLLTKTLKDKSAARRAISRLKFVSDSSKYNKKAEELDKFLEALPD